MVRMVRRWALIQKWIPVSGILTVALLVAVGIWRAYMRGGNDFSVFYEAWRWVLIGQGSQIYRVSPDRFLYSPGFAWLLSPLAFFPKTFALAVWCSFKVFFLGLIIKKLSDPWVYERPLLGVGISAWGVVLVARPLLIDFEYGQVNLLILGVCLWGVLGHFDRKTSLFWDLLRWFVLAIAAVAKLYPLPLLLVPWLITSGISRKKLKFEKQGGLAGVLISLLIPVWSQGWYGTGLLFLEWRKAVLDRGLPLESHNQSFTALLYHYLSGNPTSVLSEGAGLLFGQAWLSSTQIIFLSLFWTASAVGIILAWILCGSNHPPFKWTTIMIALLIVPSHLVWKPYFVLSMPLAIWVLHQGIARSNGRVNKGYWLSVLGIFVGINLTGFDFIGHDWAAHVEAASVLLLMHLTLIFMVFLPEGKARPVV